MLPIKAEDHVAGQQLNVRKTAQHVFSNGINCYSNEAPMEEQVHTFSILSHSECLHAAASLPSMLFQAMNHHKDSWLNPKATPNENARQFNVMEQNYLSDFQNGAMG